MGQHLKTTQRIRQIISELRKGDYYEVRARLMEEWGVCGKTWCEYVKTVNKYMGRSTKLTIERGKSIQRLRLEALYPQCFKTDPDTGEEKVNIKEALAVLERQAKLDGLDAPAKTEVDQVVTTVVDPDVQKQLLNQEISTEPLPEAPTE